MLVCWFWALSTTKLGWHGNYSFLSSRDNHRSMHSIMSIVDPPTNLQYSEIGALLLILPMYVVNSGFASLWITI